MGAVSFINTVMNNDFISTLSITELRNIRQILQNGGLSVYSITSNLSPGNISGTIPPATTVDNQTQAQKILNDRRSGALTRGIRNLELLNAVSLGTELNRVYLFDSTNFVPFSGSTALERRQTVILNLGMATIVEQLGSLGIAAESLGQFNVFIDGIANLLKDGKFVRTSLEDDIRYQCKNLAGILDRSTR